MATQNTSNQKWGYLLPGFADDTAVYVGVSNLEHAQILQGYLDRLTKWSSDLYLSPLFFPNFGVAGKSRFNLNVINTWKQLRENISLICWLNSTGTQISSFNCSSG